MITIYRLHCFIACLSRQLCQRKNLIREATRDVLKDLVYHLITILLDTRLNDLEDGQQVARSVNVTVVRIVEKADPTNVMRYESINFSCVSGNCRFGFCIFSQFGLGLIWGNGVNES